jgi:transketolase
MSGVSADTAANRRAFSEEVLARGRENPQLFVLTSDAKGSVTLTDFERELPEQFVEVGIAEQNAVGIAAGMARAGCTVFVCGPACFYSARALEQVKNDVAYSATDVKVIGVSGGVAYGALGATHHSLHDIAVFRAIPDIEIFLPADAAETKLVTRYCASSKRPAYVRLGRNPVPQIPGPTAFEPGKAPRRRAGRDITIISAGETLHRAMSAADLLAERGVEATVLDLCSIRPLDEEAIVSAARETGRIVTVEEHSVNGGIGGAVAEVVGGACPVPVSRLGFPDRHLPAGSQSELLDAFGMSPEAIAEHTFRFLQHTEGAAR